jgi:molybdopterin biosynthesis enzyme MoaB
VTGAIPGFKAGNLPAQQIGTTANLHRPTGGMNNDAVMGALPGMDQRRVIATNDNN